MDKRRLNERSTSQDRKVELERKQCHERAETLVKDDHLWKELQEELSKANVISKVKVQEITLKFLEKHRVELDGVRSPDGRRSSNPEFQTAPESKHGNRKSLIRRAFSLSTHTPNEQSTRKGSVGFSAFMKALQMERDSVGAVRDKVRQKNFLATDTVFEMLDAAVSESSLVDEIEAFHASQAQTLDSSSSLLDSFGSLHVHSEHEDNDEEVEQGAELLVSFPNQPRWQEQGERVE